MSYHPSERMEGRFAPLDENRDFTSLMSLTITATFKPSRLVRTWLSSVVFPAPRNPERTVTGSGCWDDLFWGDIGNLRDGPGYALLRFAPSDHKSGTMCNSVAYSKGWWADRCSILQVTRAAACLAEGLAKADRSGRVASPVDEAVKTSPQSAPGRARLPAGRISTRVDEAAISHGRIDSRGLIASSIYEALIPPVVKRPARSRALPRGEAMRHEGVLAHFSSSKRARLENPSPSAPVCTNQLSLALASRIFEESRAALSCR